MKRIVIFLFSIIPYVIYCQNISIGNSSVVEGSGGQRSVEVMVVISPAAAGPVDISYTTKNGTASAGSDYTAVNGTLHFNKGETMKKITVPISADNGCEPNESFDIVLSNATGATLKDPVGTVTITDDDCMAGRPGPAAYEIRLIATGYLTFSAGPPDCPVRTTGKVVLYGIVTGIEQVGADDDIMYRGTLQLDMDMDLCSIRRDNIGEDHNCVMSLFGSGPVEVELEVQFDSRGGYIKMENKSGRFIRALKGDCQQDEMDEELTMIPNRTIASVFNGLELPSLTNRTLTVGTYRN